MKGEVPDPDVMAVGTRKREDREDAVMVMVMVMNLWQLGWMRWDGWDCGWVGGCILHAWLDTDKGKGTYYCTIYSI